MSQQQFNQFLSIWKWTVTVFGAIFATVMTIFAGVLGVYMSTMDSNLANMNSRLDSLDVRLDSIDRTLIEMNGKIERNTALLEAHINDENIHNSRGK